jgi:tetratricopeptide (TPR) repeat protein
MRKPEQALEAFEKAVELDPNDGYNRRNLGGVLIGFNRLDDALGHLRAALKLLPDDPQSIFGLATALENVGTDDADVEADDLYKRFILEHPTSPMVEQAAKSRTAFAHKSMKSRTAGGFRHDVMLYMVEVLKTFKRVGAAKRREIALEIATLGRIGLDINDFESKYKLKSLPATFSGLHLLSVMYAAFKQIDPKMETGLDFSAEYKAAMDLSQK